jgi:hypothetical protein
MNSTEYAKKEAARIAPFWKGENADQLALLVEQLETYLAIAFTEGSIQTYRSITATVNQPESIERGNRELGEFA